MPLIIHIVLLRDVVRLVRRFDNVSTMRSWVKFVLAANVRLAQDSNKVPSKAHAFLRVNSPGERANKPVQLPCGSKVVDHNEQECKVGIHA